MNGMRHSLGQRMGWVAARWAAVATRCLPWARLVCVVAVAALTVVSVQSWLRLDRRVHELEHDKADLQRQLNATGVQAHWSELGLRLCERAEDAAAREVQDAQDGEGDARMEALQATAKANDAEERADSAEQSAKAAY